MHQLIANALTDLLRKWQTEHDRVTAQLNSHPSDDFFAVHKEFKELLDSGENRHTKEFSAKISNLTERERKAKRAMARRYNSASHDKLISLQFDLSQAMGEVNNMLYWHNDKEKRRNERESAIFINKERKNEK